MYGLLADAMVVFHLLYCAYVVVGQVVVVVAAPFRWGWARNPWFRYSHLLAIAVVVVEELAGGGARSPCGRSSCGRPAVSR